MKTSWRKTGKRTVRTLWRTLAFSALALKLIVPVGFMPAALADGGPFTLCESAGASEGASAHHSEHAPGHHAGQSTHYAGESTHHAGASAHHALDSLGPRPTAPFLHDGDPSHHDESGAHHQWERCALGALASLAAVAGHWPVLAVEPRSHERIPASVEHVLARRSVTGFQSRAPPYRNS